MKKENLHLYTVMHLQKDHIDEVCADIKSQIQNGVATCPIFMFKLAPEGTPPVDRAKIFCDIYREYKTRLDKMGIKNGILVQCSIGHDYIIPEMLSLVIPAGLMGIIAVLILSVISARFVTFKYSKRFSSSSLPSLVSITSSSITMDLRFL